MHTETNRATETESLHPAMANLLLDAAMTAEDRAYWAAVEADEMSKATK
jgi:hypothetical protein